MTPWELAKSGTEHGEQRALFAWAAMAERCGVRVANDPLAYQGLQASLNGVPELKWLHAIHNQGHGDAIRGARAKAEGVKAGVFDLFLPCPKWWWNKPDTEAEYFGLYIEMKKLKGGKASPLQLQFQADMIAAGYEAEFAAGWEAARDCLLRYLGRL
jgi:hypothetical protein